MGIPAVSVSKTGTDSQPIFAFAFENLKGAPGTNGANGADGVTPEITVTATVSNQGDPGCTVTKTGTDAQPSFAFAFTGLKTNASEYEVIGDYVNPTEISNLAGLNAFLADLGEDMNNGDVAFIPINPIFYDSNDQTTMQLMGFYFDVPSAPKDIFDGTAYSITTQPTGMITVGSNPYESNQTKFAELTGPSYDIAVPNDLPVGGSLMMLCVQKNVYNGNTEYRVATKNGGFAVNDGLFFTHNQTYNPQIKDSNGKYFRPKFPLNVLSGNRAVKDVFRPFDVNLVMQQDYSNHGIPAISDVRFNVNHFVGTNNLTDIVCSLVPGQYDDAWDGVGNIRLYASQLYTDAAKQKSFSWLPMDSTNNFFAPTFEGVLYDHAIMRIHQYCIKRA